MELTFKEKVEFDSSFGYELKYIAGMDEAGRGAWMGPIISACVILPSEFNLDEIDDSKKIKNEEKRHELSEKIKKSACAYGIGSVDNKIIDKIGIQQANFLSFQLALKDMYNRFNVEPELILLDGNYKDVPLKKYINVIRGDSLSVSIACASIIAKSERDKYVSSICHNMYPEYFFSNNKGYGTKKHQDAILKYGLTEYHRKTFCKRFLIKNKGE